MDLRDKTRDIVFLDGVLLQWLCAPEDDDWWKRVVLYRSVPTMEQFYIGATGATNNTGEMQALIEALLWLTSCVEQKVLQRRSAVMITADSLCVNGIVDRHFIARVNMV